MISSAFPVRRILPVALIGSLAALATACSSGGTTTPTATVTVTGTPVAGGSSPASTPTGAPTTSSAPAGPTECTTAGMHVSVGSGQGTAGTQYVSIDFTNTSSATCFVQGYPGISLVSAGSNAGSQIGSDAKHGSAHGSPVTLAPGQTAHALLAIVDAGNLAASSCNPVTAPWMRVFPPDQFVAAYVHFSTLTCASTSQPTMSVSPITAGP